MPDEEIVVPTLEPLPQEAEPTVPLKDAWSGFHDTDKAWRDK